MENNVAIKEKDIASIVLKRVVALQESNELSLPKDYNPANALKTAFLLLSEQLTTDKKPVLSACTQVSIANSLMKMVTQGLSLAKGQCYFIPYGDKLTYQRSAGGSIALSKRLGGVLDVVANIIYAKDEFEYVVNTDYGFKEISKHIQKIQNISNDEIIGAYAVVTFVDGRKDLEVMTIDEIRKAWEQGATKGKSGAHNNFTQEMCKKTVINRACKYLISSSDDSYLNVSDEPKSTQEQVHDIIEHETEDVEMVLFRDDSETHVNDVVLENKSSKVSKPSF